MVSPKGKLWTLVAAVGFGHGRFTDAGYHVLGVDLSPAMIELARQRVPEADFQVGSFCNLPIPTCRAVTALGEVFNYLTRLTYCEGCSGCAKVCSTL